MKQVNLLVYLLLSLCFAFYFPVHIWDCACMRNSLVAALAVPLFSSLSILLTPKDGQMI